MNVAPKQTASVEVRLTVALSPRRGAAASSYYDATQGKPLRALHGRWQRRFPFRALIAVVV